MAEEKKTRTPQEVKRDRQSKASRERNRANRSRVRGEVRDLRTTIDAGNQEAAAAALPGVVSTLQKMARKGILHRRTAARKISRLAKAINALKDDGAAS